MMGAKKLVNILGLSLLAVGCSSTGQLSSNEKWRNFIPNAAIATESLTSEQVMAVFIREPGAVEGTAANIFVEGKYLTSLQSGGYKAIPLCAMPTNITVAYTDINLNYPILREQKNTFDLTNNRIHYFSVIQADDHQLALKPLTEQQAQQALQHTQEQTHTLPRLEQSSICPKIVYQQAQAPQPVVKKYTLAASALFAYGKADSQNLLPQGQREIAVIAAEIKKNAVHIGQIAVIGYTDPVGSEEYNQRLSLQRAQTVRHLLIQQGVTNSNILAEGRGEHELVVSDCDARFANNKTARDECNLPNRRVEVVTYGFKAQ